MAFFVLPISKNEIVLLFDEVVLKISYLKDFVKNISLDINFIDTDYYRITINGLSYEFMVKYHDCFANNCSRANCCHEICPLTVVWRIAGSKKKFYSNKSKTKQLLLAIQLEVDRIMIQNGLVPKNFYEYHWELILKEWGRPLGN